MVTTTNGNMYASRPTILIVPGSFSPPPLYTGIVDHLIRHGYDALTVHYPSIGRRDPLPPATMADDAAFTHAVVANLADAGKSVFMVMHSYGGIVGTESLRGLSTTQREEAGKKGGVTGLLYITALVPQVGRSLVDLMGAGLTSFLRIEEGYMYSDPEGSSTVNFSDLPVSEALEWAKMMPEHSTVSFSGTLTYPGYKYNPVSYLMCTGDHVVQPALQKSMIDMMLKDGVNVAVHTIASGHCPNASVPKTVARIIMEVAGRKV